MAQPANREVLPLMWESDIWVHVYSLCGQATHCAAKPLSVKHCPTGVTWQTVVTRRTRVTVAN